MPAIMGKRRKPQDDLGWDEGPKGPVVSLRPPAAMRAILERMAREQRRSMAQTIQLLLEEVLASKGLWPPAPSA